MMASFSGPVIGGAFATIGEWRLAYWAFAVQGLLLIPAVLYLLRGAEPEVNLAGERIPIVRLLLLSASILLVSISGAYYHPLGSPILILLGCLALLLFVFRDQAAISTRMLPAEVTDLAHSIGNGILATLLLCISIMTFVFPRGLLWAVVATVIILNGGFGMMWGFIIKRIIGAAWAADKDRAASLLPITQQTGFALGAALSGLVANSIGLNEAPTAPELRLIAFWLFAGFVPIALLGNIMASCFVGRKN